MHQSALPREIPRCSLWHSSKAQVPSRSFARRAKEPSRCRQRQVQPRAVAASYSSEPAAHTREVEHVDVQDGQFTVTGCLRTPVPSESVWKVLTDYEGLARTYSTVLESHSRLVDKQQQVMQKCKWEFLVFSGSFDTRLAVSEDPSAGTLVFRQLHSSFMRNFEGRWQVDALPAGGCTARHTLSVTPVISPPQIFEGPTRGMFSSQVERLLADLEAELARRYPQAVK